MKKGPEKIAYDREYRKKNAEKISARSKQSYKRKQLLPHVTQARLKELLEYDKETGIFRYLVARGAFGVGTVAGHVAKDNRVNINIDGRLYRASRLVWLYVTGNWPIGEIDHIDTNPSNNSWCNLRDVSATINQQNKRKAPISKKYSKLFGAHWCKQIKRWKSSIRVNGKVVRLGCFDTDVEASQAYIAAKRKFHEGCTL